jgi:hypothetical protein
VVNFLRKIDIELFLVLFLLSGMFKSLFFSFSGDNSTSIPFTLIFGGLLVTMVLVKKEYSIQRLKNEFTKHVFLILFFIWCSVSTFYTSSENYVWYKLIALGTNLLAFYSVLITNKINVKKFTLYFSFFLFFLSLFFFIINPNSLSKNFPFHAYFNELYIQGWYLTLGQFLAANIFLVFYLKDHKRIIYMLLVSFNLIFLFAGRFPIIIGLFSIAILSTYLLITKKINREILIQLIKSVVVILFINGAFYLTSSNYKEIIKRTVYRFEVLSSNTEIDFEEKDHQLSNKDNNYSYNKRLEYFIFSKENIFKSSKSILIGYGLGSFSKEFSNEDKRLYPHNIILEIFFELGIIGLLLMLGLVITNIKIFKSFLTNFALLAVIILFLNAMKSSSIVDLRVLFALYAISIFHFKELKPKT